MRSILISIKPEWVEKIFTGKKILEIRKSIPKCNLPCKVYIYCTQSNKYAFYHIKDERFMLYKGTRKQVNGNLSCGTKLNGKVVAEFTLHDIETIDRDYNDWLPKRMYDIMPSQLEASCLTEEQLNNYGKGKTLHAWYIDDLKIYKQPKELNEFKKDLDCDDYPCNKNTDCKYNYYDTSEGCWACGIDFDGANCIYKQINKAPQSWCYVEEIK